MCDKVEANRRQRASLIATCVAIGLSTTSVASAQELGDEWRLSSEPVFVVGSIDGPPNELFMRIIGALRLDDGRYVVADSRELRLSVYDATGELRAQFGRSGEGPGEFQEISGMWTAGGDTIGVWDPRSRRITRFLTDGTVVGTHTPRFGPGGSPVEGARLDGGFLGALSDGRIVLAWLSARLGASGELASDRMVFGLFASDGTFLEVLGEGTGMVRVHQPGVGSGPHAFSPYPWAAVARDSLAYTNGVAGRISMFAPGTSSRGPARTLTVPADEWTLGEAWARLEPALERGNAPAYIVELSRSMNVRIDDVPRLARMFADDAGRLWVKEYDPSWDSVPLRGTRFVAGGRWRVVDTGGRAIAWLRMPADAAPIGVYGNEVLAVVRDALGVERFAVYRIER